MRPSQGFQSQITNHQSRCLLPVTFHLSLSPSAPPLTSHQSLLTSHGRDSGQAVRFQDLFLAFSPGASRLEFGISYSRLRKLRRGRPSSSSRLRARLWRAGCPRPRKRLFSGKDWLNSGKAPSPNCTWACGLKVPSKHRSWPACGGDSRSYCERSRENKRQLNNTKDINISNRDLPLSFLTAG